MTPTTRDISKYKSDLKEFDSLDALLRSDEVTSGLYSIRHYGDVYTDVLFWNQRSDVTVVCFNGAGAPVSGNRPGFNGTSTFNSWKLENKANFVFIHDATLYLDPTLRLAWYTGSEDFKYPELLEKIIRRFITINRPDTVIFFGNSGGGHAALHYSARFPGSIVVAGTPQTSVDRYADGAKNRYYKTCWPNVKQPGEDPLTKPLFDMNTVYSGGTDNLVYCFVNADDSHHIDDHLIPFIEAGGSRLNIRTAVRHWGRGHAAIAPHEFLELFEELVARRRAGELFPNVKRSRLLETSEEVRVQRDLAPRPALETVFRGRLADVTEIRFDLARTAGSTLEVRASSVSSDAAPVRATIEFLLGDTHDRGYVFGLRPTNDGYETTLVLRPGSEVLLRTYLPEKYSVQGMRLMMPSGTDTTLTELTLTSYGHSSSPARVPTSADRARVTPSVAPARQRPISPAAASVVKADDPSTVVDLSSVSALEPAAFPLDTPTRVDVVTTECVIPMLVVRRPMAERTVILSNGAVNLKRSGGGPVFQRSTWWKEIKGHQIFVCDPGTVGKDAIGLSWGHLSADYWAVPDISLAVRDLARVLGSPEPQQRVYYGSSGGGFMSIGLCTFDPGSRAVVNNAQLDWTRWMPRDVNNLRSARFGPVSPADIREKSPTTSSVLRLIASRDAAPRIDYLVNLASKHDSGVELPMIRNFIDEHPNSGANIRVFPYRDDASGHNPLPKDLALACLHQDVAEVPLPGA